MGRLVVTLAAIAATGPVFAADKSYLSLAYTRTADESQTGGTEVTREVQILNATLGYVNPPGLTLGVKYFQYTYNGTLAVGDEGVTTTGFGPLIGFYHQSGVYLNSAYLLSPKKTYDNERTSLFDGSGIVTDIGKAFEVDGFGVGVQMTYSNIDYRKTKVDGQNEEDLDGTWSDTSLYPYVTLFVYF